MVTDPGLVTYVALTQDRNPSRGPRVPRINVLLVMTSPDLKAEVIAEAVAARSDMVLVRGRSLSVAEAGPTLDELPALAPSALILVGRSVETGDLIERWRTERPRLIVMQVDVIDDIVQISLRDPRLDSLLNSLRALVEGAVASGRERIAHVELRSPRPLLKASIDWVHELLRDAVARVPDENGDVNGLSVTRATLLQALDAADAPADRPRDLQYADAALDAVLAAADARQEPLAAAKQGLDLAPLEFRMLVLGLAPELDLRFQRCIGFLLDEMPRRVGTFGLYSTLLGSTAQIRGELAQTGAFGRWPIFEGVAGQHATADEPLRLDPFLTQWLLGQHDALEYDPRVRRVLRLVNWFGTGLLSRHEEHASAAVLIGKLLDSCPTSWVLLGGTDPAAARALLEHGAKTRRVKPIRVEAACLAGMDLVDVEECARRLGRMRRLTGDPMIIDLVKWDGAEADDDGLCLFLKTLGDTGGTTALIGTDEARVIRLLGSAPFELIADSAFPMDALVAAVRTAAKGADAHLTADAAEAIARRFPLHVDGLEHAMAVARSRPKNYDADDPELARFTAACKEVATEGISQLADRIEPVFNLDDVVLPADRKDQLVEIVDNVRLTPRVLDEWKFRDQLPYGRGVTALFFGSSGTGKTMAAIGIACRLGIQLLRLDLSRVVSKYIGDTEKNIDRVFTDAQRSGSAILIDEADALLGKRSEVKDAHDRYANIEVAYLLQRMEAYDGLAILTTNMQQNLDPAFLRRLRFIVDFPRPDAEAREKIWRQCLPSGSHQLGDADFSQLARKIDLTGGHIRQITLRAAFIAAAAGAQINLDHIGHAARAEFAKLGMPPVEIDPSKARLAA
jgi:AAA+ superfamily predicted ATPase